MLPGGIRTRNPSRRAAADPRLRLRDHWDWQQLVPYLEKDKVFLYYKYQPIADVPADNLVLLLGRNLKGKSVPLQAWSGPEGSRKLRFPDFMTTAQDGGKVVSPTHRPPSPPGNAPGTHFC